MLLPNGGGPATGIDPLEGLVRKYPNRVENHLRLAEGLVAQNDAENATPHLCHAIAHKQELRRDDQILVDRVYVQARKPKCPDPPPAPSAPAPKP